MAGQNANTLPLHGSGKDRRTAAFFPQQILERDFAVDERQLRHRRGAQAHLVKLLADGESWRAFIKDEAVVTAAIAQRFEGTNSGEGIGLAAPEFGGNGKALDAELGAFLPEVPGEFFVQVTFNDVVVQFFFGKTDDFLTKLTLFLTPCKVQERSLSIGPLIWPWISVSNS